MKKYLTLFLAMMAMVVSAQEQTSGDCGDKVTWSYDESSQTLTLSGTGAMCDYKSVDPYENDFTGAAPWMENYRNQIHSVIVDEGVTAIGGSAFYYCEQITSVSLPSSLTSIGQYAFCACKSLPTINFPDGLKSIENYAVNNCDKLTSVVLPASLESLGISAFQSCDKLSSIELPASLKNIGNLVFQASIKISDITVHWTSLEGVSIGDDIFHSHPSLGSINLHIPAGTKSIYENAEPWKNLKIVEVYPTSGKCGDNVSWSYDESSGTLTLSGSGAMYDYKTFDIGKNNFTEAAPWMENYWDRIQSVVVDEGVTTIGNYAFFSSEDLTSVSLPSSLTSIGEQAFYDCSKLPTITFPDGLKSIGDDAFKNCRALTSLVLPASLESLEGWAFQSCDNLSSVELPASLKTIGNYVFQECKKISDITVHWTSLEGVSIGDNIFNAHPNVGSVNLHVPYGTKEVYANADPWKDLHIVEAIPSGTCGENLTWIIQNDTLTISGTGAMEDYKQISGGGGATNPWNDYLKNVKAIVVEEGVTSVGKYAFYLGQTFTSLSLPSTLTSFGFYACYGCVNLEKLNLPEGLQYISNGAFSYCMALKTLDIPASVNHLGMNPFGNCTGLTDITLHWTSLEGLSIDDNYTPFLNVNTADINLHVPAGTKSIYEAADHWKNFKIIEAEATGIESQKSKVESRKLLRNGQLIILRGDNTYTVTGQMRK